MIRNLSPETIIPILWQREAGKITGFLCHNGNAGRSRFRKRGCPCFRKNCFRNRKMIWKIQGAAPKKVIRQFRMSCACPGPKCKNILFVSDLAEEYSTCPKCGHLFRMNARQRISMIADDKSFVEHDRDMHSVNVLDFPGYENKLKHAVLNSRETEGVVCGNCTIGSYPCCLFVMESGFMMGSMGSVVGEKITRLFEYATKHSLPVIGYTVSGGARMQEGILSLMQMAKPAARSNATVMQETCM